jgi:carboxymethylenebutenolidase
VDPRIIALYDEYTHTPLPRRTFLERLAVLAGGTTAAAALLPLLDNNYARAAIVEPADARIATERVRIRVPSGEMTVYVATPRSGPAKRGGVVAVHENRGLNPHIEDIARRLALAGFTGVAVDLLSSQGGTPTDEDKAREMFMRIDPKIAVADLVAVVDWVAARPDANGRVGAVGFCWGGGMVNLLATASPKLAAGVPFYGVAPPSADVAKIRARMLIHYAGNDARVNATRPDYEAALKAAHVDYRMFVYDGAEHAFNNDTAGARYNAAAATLAWSRTIEFLQQALAAG